MLLRLWDLYSSKEGASPKLSDTVKIMGGPGVNLLELVYPRIGLCNGLPCFVVKTSTVPMNLIIVACWETKEYCSYPRRSTARMPCTANIGFVV